MKIRSSSTQVFFSNRGGGISGMTRGSGRVQKGQASYGATGFGSGGASKVGKGRKSPSPAPAPPPRRRP